MIRYLIMALSLLALLAGSSCRNGTWEQSPPDTSSSPTSDTLCYQQVLNRDTTSLKLAIKNGLASGYLDIRPYEKDRAQGAFEGTYHNKTIRANWQRSGEGTTQAYLLDLTLHGDTLSWYEGERLEKEGVWVLKSPKAGYQYVLTKTNCP